MSRKDIDSHARYYNILVQNKVEFENLVNLLTINETYFFREPSHLKILARSLIPTLLARKKPGSKVNVLSAGCSTGEEPYSIVIALMEEMGQGVRSIFHIVGVDIDSEAISRARGGIYGGQSFRSFDDTLKAKYFDRVSSDRYKIKEDLKEVVDFRIFNLLSDRYPEDLCGMDVIFYRNVSIYFDADIQRRIFSNLAKSLKGNGYLMTSSTETLSHNFDVLSLLEIDGVFLYQKQGAPCPTARGRTLVKAKPLPVVERRAAPAPGLPVRLDQGRMPPCNAPSSAVAQARRPEPSVAPPLRKDSERGKDASGLFEEALAFARMKKYDEGLEIIERIIEIDKGVMGAYTLKASILVNREQLEDAERVCSKALSIDPLCLEAYLLLGLISKLAGDADGSVKRFKQALYVRSSCWLAHFHLAEIFRGRGDRENARREYNIVLNILEKEGVSDPGLNFFPLAIPPDQMVHVCHHNLENLTRTR